MEAETTAKEESQSLMHQILQNLTDASTQATHSFTHSFTTWGTGLSDLPQKVAQEIINFLTEKIEVWQQGHPIVGWFTSHPLMSLGVILVGLLVLRGLLDAIGRLTERIWLAILGLPVRLASQLFSWGFRLFDRSTPSPALEKALTPQQRVAAILDRLEVLKQEQEELLKEIRSILGSKQV